jgi:hypothetical protein
MSDAEWHALVLLHSNLLLEGHLSATDQVLRALYPHLVGPIFCWRAATQLSLPRDHRGSLLLFGVTGMSEDDQERVFEWLTHVQERVQVVSTTTQPLFASVERGEFRADLYYRLSVLRICAVSAAQHRTP